MGVVMRFIGKHRDMNLRHDQLSLLSCVLSKLEGEKEIAEFLRSLLAPSELAYISQRLHIMKLLLAQDTYHQIQHEVGTTPGTISVTKLLLKEVSDKNKLIIANQKMEDGKPTDTKYFEERENWIKPHYPGAIK